MNEKIVIEENYRGFQITFDKYQGVFLGLTDSWIDEEYTSTTLKGCKKKIDEFVKENENFEPFIVIHENDLWGSMHSGPKITKLKVMGKRKDNRFACLSEDGIDKQINPSYKYADSYIISNKETIDKIKEKQERINLIDSEINKLKKQRDKIAEEKIDFQYFEDWVKKKFPDIKIREK